MDELRRQVNFREPFVAPRTRVENRLRSVLLYGLAGICGLCALATAFYFYVFPAGS